MRLDDLTNQAERDLWTAFSRGETVDLSGDPSGPPFDLATWSPAQSVRGEVVKALLLGANPPVPGYTPKLSLVGARIAGCVDLSARSTWVGRRSAALYALDALLPGSPFGLEPRVHLTGTPGAVSIALQAVGWALSIAMLPALTRVLSRSDR